MNNNCISCILLFVQKMLLKEFAQKICQFEDISFQRWRRQRIKNVLSQVREVSRYQKLFWKGTWKNGRIQVSPNGVLTRVAAIAQWIRLRLPSCPPGSSPKHSIYTFSIFKVQIVYLSLELECKKNENNKRGRDLPIF